MEMNILQVNLMRMVHYFFGFVVMQKIIILTYLYSVESSLCGYHFFELYQDNSSIHGS